MHFWRIMDMWLSEIVFWVDNGAQAQKKENLNAEQNWAMENSKRSCNSKLRSSIGGEWNQAHPMTGGKPN